MPAEKKDVTSQAQSATVSGSTKVELALRIAASADASSWAELMPALSVEPKVRSVGSGSAAPTVYYWSLKLCDSRDIGAAIGEVVEALRSHARSFALLRTRGARVELVMSLEMRSDFGGIELSAVDQALLARLEIPLDVHVVANVGDDRGT